MRGFLLFVAALVALRLLGVGAHPAPKPEPVVDEQYQPPLMVNDKGRATASDTRR